MATTPATWSASVVITGEPYIALEQVLREARRTNDWPQSLHAIAANPIIETPEQRAARQAMRDRYAAEQAEHDATYRARQRALHDEHTRANARAERLLIEHLSPRQSEELRASGHFHVQLMNGRRYRISRGQHGNVVEVDGAGRGLRSLCVQPMGHLPDADAMLAQKLWLETDEATLLRTANITPMRARA